MTDSKKWLDLLEKSKSLRYYYKEDLAKKESELKKLVIQRLHCEKALTCLQEVSLMVQEALERSISETVTYALNYVFEDSYTFRIVYEIKRNKSEASLYLEKNGEFYDILDDCAGGVADVVSFALRLALWSINSRKTRNTFVFDEPFKNVSAKYHEKIGEMMRMLCENMNVQIIMVTHIERLKDFADRTFFVDQENGVSFVEVL